MEETLAKILKDILDRGALAIVGEGPSPDFLQFIRPISGEVRIKDGGVYVGRTLIDSTWGDSKVWVDQQGIVTRGRSLWECRNWPHMSVVGTTKQQPFNDERKL